MRKQEINFSQFRRLESLRSKGITGWALSHWILTWQMASHNEQACTREGGSERHASRRGFVTHPLCRNWSTSGSALLIHSGGWKPLTQLALRGHTSHFRLNCGEISAWTLGEAIQPQKHCVSYASVVQVNGMFTCYVLSFFFLLLFACLFLLLGNEPRAFALSYIPPFLMYLFILIN